jgi:protein-S-isoprenylcysteine O-methyltransferase Ste14
MAGTLSRLSSLRHLLPLLTDSAFIVLASYSVIAIVRSMWMSAGSQETLLIYQILFLIFQAAALFLFLVRKGVVSVSSNVRDYVFTLGALGSPMFFQPISAIGGSLVGVSLALVGGIVVISAFLSLNRSFGIAPENRGIQTRGIYRIVRHPMYFGYVLTETGFIIDNPSLFNMLIFAMATFFLILRIRSEEQLLRKDGTYRRYIRNTSWRLLPFVF